MDWSSDGSGVRVTAPTRAGLLEEIRRRFRDHQGFSIATLNLDHAVKLARDSAFRAAYARQSLVTADGNPVVWLSRLSGQRDVELVPGSELISPVADLAAAEGVSVGLYGATEASLSAAAAALRDQHPGLAVDFVEAPPMGFDPDGTEAGAAIDRIRASGARMIFLALGAPKQERFAARAQEALPGVGFLSIGAGLDFISGAQMRAPKLVRVLAAEWLWRMLGNPRRLAARYGACILALPGLTLRAVAARRAKGAVS